MNNIRPAAVAGVFYPQDATELSHDIQMYLDNAAQGNPAPVTPKALIVPHAGYIYSGLTAAYAYQHIRPKQFQRVVLFGPTHRIPVYGLAAPTCDAFITPLGEVLLDKASIEAAAVFDQVSYHDATHSQEHALEVQIPFLQHQLDTFKLVPFAVGQSSAEDVAEIIQLYWDDSDTLIIISSDLSHFNPYKQAQSLDAQSCKQILHGAFPLNHEQACGATAINGLLYFMQQHPMQIHLLDYRNSGDTAGNKDNVVGYASFACSEPAR